MPNDQTPNDQMSNDQGHAKPAARSGQIWLYAAAAGLVVGVLAAADAIFAGVLSSSLGSVTLLWIAAGLAVAAFVCSAIAAAGAPDATQILAVIMMTLTVVLFITAVLLFINRQAWIGPPPAAEHPIAAQ